MTPGQLLELRRLRRTGRVEALKDVNLTDDPRAIVALVEDDEIERVLIKSVPNIRQIDGGVHSLARSTCCDALTAGFGGLDQGRTIRIWPSPTTLTSSTCPWPRDQRAQRLDRDSMEYEALEVLDQFQ